MNETTYRYETTQFTFGPAVGQEQSFCFSWENEPIDNACVGHLRGDFGTLGKRFYTSWFPHNNALKTQTVVTQLDDVVNALRREDILTDRPSMQRVLARNPQAVIHSQYRPESAFRAETDQTLFFLRCIPQKGDYNFYVYVYDKARFYNILREQRQMPPVCWTRNKQTGQVFALYYGAAQAQPVLLEGVPPQDTQQIVDAMNQKQQVSKAQLAAMEAGCLFGWNIPAADPKNYDADGKLLPHPTSRREVVYER